MSSRAGKPKGHKKSGGRQKGVGNRVPPDVRAICQTYSARAVRTLARIMMNKEEGAAARVAAAREILDRAHGKPVQAVKPVLPAGFDGSAPVGGNVGGSDAPLKDNLGGVNLTAAAVFIIPPNARDTSE